MGTAIRRILVSLAAIGLLVSGIGATSASASEKAPRSSKSVSVVLKSLKVAPEVRSGYDRSLFRHWIDASRNGCDTRQEVLIRQSLISVTRSAGCRVVQGRWVSAFDGVVTTNPSTFDIDHLVPLAEAWDSGAHRWSPATREAFANDLGFRGSLIAVSASSNRSKSDRDPAEWLPPMKSYVCDYVTTWIAVKHRWSLAIDRSERTALRKNVKSCGNPRINVPSQVRIMNR